MKKTLFAIAAGVIAAGCCSICGGDYSDVLEDEGFVSLFNGKDLTGWVGATSTYGVETIKVKMRGTNQEKEFKVLACQPEKAKQADGKEGSGGNLCTAKQYENFILRFEFCMPENGNNGLGIRMTDINQNAAYDGMCELQLLDDGGSRYYDAAAKADKLKPYQYTASVYGVVPAKRDNYNQTQGKAKNYALGGSYLKKAGEWNFEEVRVAGSRIQVLLNGILVTDADLSKFKGDGDTPDGKKHPGIHNKKGHIGWLGHGHRVMWRNIRIKELPADACLDKVCPCLNREIPGFTRLFDGKTLANWKGVTRVERFDNPLVRQKATPAKRAEIQKIADKQMTDHWTVRNGALFFDGLEGGYSLATIKDYKDFEMFVDWRILSVQGDSGLYLRGAPQVQIWDAHNQWDIGSGGLYNNKKNADKALCVADNLPGDWNRFHIKMVGEKVTVWLNGKLVVDNTTLENYWDRNQSIFPVEQVELQCHGDPLEFRNIYIRDL